VANMPLPQRKGRVMVKAADLPDGLKQELLRSLASQVGQPVVNRMVAQYGKDAVIDMVLQAVLRVPDRSSVSSGRTGITSRHSSFNRWSDRFASVSRLVHTYWMLCTIVVCAFGWAGVVLLATVMGLIFAVSAVASQINIWKTTSATLAWTLGSGLVLTLLVGVGYVMWIGVPWIAVGVRQWWQWLGGHFQ
jgi:hypothetical protein